MYELRQVGEKTYYMDCPSKVGMYLEDKDHVWLIDSGNCRDAGKKALRLVEEQGWQVRGIFNTHPHADHVGGNRCIQQRTGCPAYVYGPDLVFVQNTPLLNVLLFGARPCGELKHKFLQAEQGEALAMTPEILPAGLELFPCPGHSLSMVAIHTSDDVWFVADAVTSAATLEKYPVTFILDVEQHRESLRRMQSLEGRLFVPSHGEPVTDFAALIALNLKKMDEIMALLLELCLQPRNFEAILQLVFQRYGMTMDVAQYVLVGDTIRSYLSLLHDQDKLDIVITDSVLYWQTKK